MVAEVVAAQEAEGTVAGALVVAAPEAVGWEVAALAEVVQAEVVMVEEETQGKEV